MSALRRLAVLLLAALATLAALPLKAADAFAPERRAEAIAEALEHGLRQHLQAGVPQAGAGQTGGDIVAGATPVQRARLAGAGLAMADQSHKAEARAAYDASFNAIKNLPTGADDTLHTALAELWWRVSDSRAADRLKNAAADGGEVKSADVVRRLLAGFRVMPDKATVARLEQAHTFLAERVKLPGAQIKDVLLLLEVRQALGRENNSGDHAVDSAAGRVREFAATLEGRAAGASAGASVNLADSASLEDVAFALAALAFLNEDIKEDDGVDLQETLLKAWNKQAAAQAQKANPAQLTAILEAADAAAEAAQGPRAAAKPVEMTRTVQVDFGFNYYRGRSAESIVDEIAANGFDTVFIMVLGNRPGPEGFVEAAQARGLKVWGMFMPSGIYTDRSMFPPQWRQWLMEFSAPNPFGIDFISYIHKDFVAWWREHLAGMYQKYPLDGMVFAEAHYPISQLNAAAPVVSDVSPAFAKAFFMRTGHRQLPDFSNPASPLYFKKPENSTLYKDLVEFRVQTLIEFYRGVWFGKDGMATRLPQVARGTWSLGINRRDGVEFLREFESQDAPLMIARLQPDIHYFQTHAPDWMNPNLKADYVRTYAPFISPVAAAWPALPLGFQADVASTMPFRRSPQWMGEFEADALKRNIDATTYYEFSLRSEVFFNPPVLKRALLGEDGEIILSFDQRVDEKSAKGLVGRAVGGREIVEVIGVDGNRLELRLSGELPLGVPLQWPLGGVGTDPAVRLPMPQQGAGKANAIAEGATVTLPLERLSENGSRSESDSRSGNARRSENDSNSETDRR